MIISNTNEQLIVWIKYETRMWAVHSKHIRLLTSCCITLWTSQWTNPV